MSAADESSTRRNAAEPAAAAARAASKAGQRTALMAAVWQGSLLPEGNKFDGVVQSLGQGIIQGVGRPRIPYFVLIFGFVRAVVTCMASYLSAVAERETHAATIVEIWHRLSRRRGGPILARALGRTGATTTTASEATFATAALSRRLLAWETLSTLVCVTIETAVFLGAVREVVILAAGRALLDLNSRISCRFRLFTLFVGFCAGRRA